MAASFFFKGNNALSAFVTDALVGAGFQIAEDIASAEVVITYCTSLTELEDLYFAEGGLVQACMPNTAFVDLSPSSINLSDEISAVCIVNDLSYSACPLIVNNKAAEEPFDRDNLSCFVGSGESDPTQAIEICEVLCSEVANVEQPSRAQLARAALTIQRCSEIVSAVEVMSLFRASADTFSEDELSSLVPKATSSEAAYIMDAIREGRFNGPYTVEMLMGELSAVMMCADDCGLIVPQTEAVFQLYELLAVIGGADMAPSALSLVYDGEEGPDAEKVGLDWSRAGMLYDGHDHDFDDDEEMFYAGDMSEEEIDAISEDGFDFRVN